MSAELVLKSCDMLLIIKLWSFNPLKLAVLPLKCIVQIKKIENLKRKPLILDPLTFVVKGVTK